MKKTISILNLTPLFGFVNHPAARGGGIFASYYGRRRKRRRMKGESGEVVREQRGGFYSCLFTGINGGRSGTGIQTAGAMEGGDGGSVTVSPKKMNGDRRKDIGVCCATLYFVGEGEFQWLHQSRLNGERVGSAAAAFFSGGGKK
ncbi:hypothetical protein HAX54_022120 [Datura stramonium]|uniref:Uncharacterized protein n=1 Tax=Datura stramonium TaxID=4076 RepID=A0ABS8S440_DATST|nr:hypothetical protein [Datura stramonium]